MDPPSEPSVHNTNPPLLRTQFVILHPDTKEARVPSPSHHCGEVVKAVKRAIPERSQVPTPPIPPCFHPPSPSVANVCVTAMGSWKRHTPHRSSRMQVAVQSVVSMVRSLHQPARANIPRATNRKVEHKCASFLKRHCAGGDFAPPCLFGPLAFPVLVLASLGPVAVSHLESWHECGRSTVLEQWKPSTRSAVCRVPSVPGAVLCVIAADCSQVMNGESETKTRATKAGAVHRVGVFGGSGWDGTSYLSAGRG